MPISFLRTSSVGFSASPLSGQGSSEPKKPCLPQCPRMAHLPASCLVVNPSTAAEAVARRVKLRRESDLKEGTSILAGWRAGAREAKGARSQTVFLVVEEISISVPTLVYGLILCDRVSLQ